MLTNIHRYYLYSEEQPYLNYDYRRLDTKQFRYRLLIHTNDRQFPLDPAVQLSNQKVLFPNHKNLHSLHH
jgi:hypothetical protein